MTSFADSPQEALILSALVAMAVAVTLAGILRRRGMVATTDLLLPAAFLGAYWLTYNKVPGFPPVGAVNKVFYIAVAGTLVGWAAERMQRPRLVAALALGQPVVVAIYIGQSRLLAAPWEVGLAAAFGMALVRLLLIPTESSDIRRSGLLIVAALGFSPIALLGASSSTFQLGAIFAAAGLGSLVWHIRNPRFRFGGASILGAAGGLIAAVDTVVLITRKTDLAALAMLGLAILLPVVFADRLNQALGLSGPPIKLAVYLALAVIPAGAAVAIAWLNYGASFPI